MKRNAINELKAEITGWRRSLHENPGLMYDEIFASQLVAEQLTAMGIQFVRGIGKTGIVATIEGQKNTSGKRIGLRADMDALPLDEKSGQPWASKTPGIMHACGHDGHTATLLGAAKYLASTRNFDGVVRLIFQPAEEGGRGAFAMIDDGLFKGDLDCDFVYGFHNWPYMPLGKAGIRPGPQLAAVDEFKAKITGKGGHAAYPHVCVDSIVVFAEIAQALQTVVSRTVQPQEPCVLSITNVHAGHGAHNVIPDELTFNGTVRSYSNAVRDLVEAKMRKLITDICTMHGAKAEFEYQRNIDPTINDPKHAVICGDAMAKILGEENVDRNVTPSMGGEDFGGMLAARPGAYIYVGQGVKDKDSPHNFQLHNPHYDFNDDLSPIVIDYMAELVESQMPLKG